LERRRKRTNRDTRGALSEDAIRKDSAGSPLELPYITELIEEGQITIGVIRPVGESVAVANDGESTLAMLVRRRRRNPEPVAEASGTRHRQGPHRGRFYRRD
jgi:hypothetical protein